MYYSIKKSYAISKFSKPDQYVLEFVQIYFGTVKEKNMYLIDETTHCVRFTKYYVRNNFQETKIDQD